MIFSEHIKNIGILIVKQKIRKYECNYSVSFTVHVKITDSRTHMIIPWTWIFIRFWESICFWYRNTRSFLTNNLVIANSSFILWFEICAMCLSDQIACSLVFEFLVIFAHAFIDVVTACSWIFVEIVHWFWFSDCICCNIELLVFVMTRSRIEYCLIILYPRTLGKSNFHPIFNHPSCINFIISGCGQIISIKYFSSLLPDSPWSTISLLLLKIIIKSLNGIRLSIESTLQLFTQSFAHIFTLIIEKLIKMSIITS